MTTDFRDKIPTLALSFPTTDAFVSLLDGLYNHKKSLQDHFFRAYTAALNPYRSDLERYLRDEGFPAFSEPLPMVVLHTLALNAGKIMSYRGSVIGVRLFLQSLTLGTVTANYTNFFPRSLAISPNDRNTGFLPEEPEEDAWYVYSPDEEELDSSFTAHIETYFNDNSAVKRYLTNHLTAFLPFFESFTKPKVTFSCGAIRKVDDMPEYFNFSNVYPATSYLYYDTLKVLLDEGYTLSASCLYDSCKLIYSDGATTEEPSFPLTSCDILGDNYLQVLDYCAFMYSDMMAAAEDANLEWVAPDECIFDLVLLFCEGFGLSADNDAVGAVNALDYLTQQSYSL